MRARSSDLREQRIARQIEVVLAQEDALDRRRDEVREREERLARKEQDLDRRRHELDGLWATRTGELDERERRVAERERSLDQRSKALEEVARRRARVLAEETVSLAERNREVAWRAKAVEAVFPDLAPEPVPEPVSAPAAAVGEDTEEIAIQPPVPADGWNLNRIERLVEEHAAANPGRIDEWRYYLLYLREFAEINGALPRSFDWLVLDAFGDLLTLAPLASRGEQPVPPVGPPP
jgi:DNA repair exonuclease SbcCD ATPase subunit